MIKRLGNWFYPILLVILAAIFGITKIATNKIRGKVEYEKGYSAALDTFQKIMIEKAKSDTSVLKLVIVNPDTFTCYLSSKYKRK